MNFFTYFIIKLIEVYKFLLSPLLGDTCRYFPTCSDYSIESLQKHGLLKGLFLSFKRILSCHPWGKGGFEPVQKEMKVKK